MGKKYQRYASNDVDDLDENRQANLFCQHAAPAKIGTFRFGCVFSMAFHDGYRYIL